jgi:hypothetical protein
MGEIVNLRRARKARDRDAAARTAAENRSLHSRTRAERATEAETRDRTARLHEGHRLDGDG